MNKFHRQFVVGSVAALLVFGLYDIIWVLTHLEDRPKKVIFVKPEATPTPSLTIKKKFGPFEFEYTKK
jgi:hypothetical protein